MQIGTGTSINPYSQSALGLKEKESEEFKEKIKSGEISGKTLSQAYLVEYSLKIESYSSNNLQAQSAPFDLNKVRDILSSIDFEAIGYTGKPIADMSPDEAKELVSEEGYFGVTKTSERLANFVLSGGGDDLERLKAGREGVIRGFNEAEEMWGGKLPEISYETLEKTLAKIDEKITALGGNVLDTTA
ncbi:hydrogenase-4 component G [Sulfuricurvum sp. RIFCSPLOWO2_12_FULL_43_24]|uniref:hydrogenase-4 component G n=1 Tax=Sulfuricurvum sp. RIFCSPLOWO2_12_FULL_43_24 TaxID=1802247 RepID=UPI0008B387BC|nr:hydrogenase-4 component G [Sulfuricurvum sp. RIFCSPLOWO2_12_FULL_43_24]OHD89001.1 MAG: hydrogenase-4 component G [Sulfuricurvum sp. RIFCSPLOWO2_12_FULL_43_24]